MKIVLVEFPEEHREEIGRRWPGKWVPVIQCMDCNRMLSFPSTYWGSILVRSERHKAEVEAYCQAHRKLVKMQDGGI
jgi:hypothetical protein